MSSRVRRCDVAIGATVVHPVTGRPFEVTFNGYTSDGNFASGWRTLRGTDLATGEAVTTIDIWELGVETLGADDIEAAGYAALDGPGAGTEYRQADQPAVADDRGYRNTIVEPSGETQRRALTAWEDIMRARTAEDAHAVVDDLNEATLRRLCQRMDLPDVESQTALREQVAAAVEQRAEDLRLYEQQPFDDLTGVPDDVGRRACPRGGCGGTLTAVAGTQHFDADGGALVDTECDRGCGIASFDSWVWSRHEAPACDPTYYDEDDEDAGESGDPSPKPVDASDDRAAVVSSADTAPGDAAARDNGHDDIDGM